MKRLGVLFLLIFGATLFSIPFLWTVSTALKNNEQVFAMPPQWIPNPVQWGNFQRAWTELPFPTFVTASTEFPELRVEAEWNKEGAKGGAAIERGRLVEKWNGERSAS